MRKIGYAIIGAAVLGTFLYSITPSSKSKKVLPESKPTLETRVNQPDISPVDTKRDITPPKLIMPGYLPQNIPPIQNNEPMTYGKLDPNNSINSADILADDCEGNCLYYTDEEGNIYQSEVPQESFYDPFNDCTGHMEGNGWVLLDSEREVALWGINNSDKSIPPEKLMKFYCDN